MWRLRRPIHSSWCIALACSGFVCGVAAALLAKLSFAWGIAAIAALAYGFFIRNVYTLPFLFIGSIVLGVSYGSAHIAERSHYQVLVGSQVSIRGRVREDPSRSPSGSTSLQLDSVSVDASPMPGAVFVSVRGSPGVKRGDVIEATGVAKPGFANFPISLSVTKLKSVVRSPTADMGRVVRDWFADKVREVIPEPQASLGIGFLTGQKSALPSDLADSLKIAGLTHIVVASGYNLTILVQMARKVFLRASKFLSAISSGVMILAFMAVTGLSPSMTRAGLVSGMSLLSWYYGHSFHPFILLPLAAALTVGFQPSYVWGDLGWQLSFAAFAGVMFVAPLLQAYFFGDTPPKVFRQILGETISAHAVTVPVIAISFGVISNVAIIANLLVVPFVPIAMLLTFLCGLGVMLSVPFIGLLAAPTSWLLEYMISVARFVSEIPWAQSEIKQPALFWLAYACVLGALCLYVYKKTNYNFRGT